MKTATLLLTLSTLTAPYAYCQAAGESAGAAAASTTTTAGAAGTLGGAQQNAISPISSGTASARGPTVTTVRSGRMPVSAMRVRRVSAELTQSINSKDAKVGDEVAARTTSAVQFVGLRLPSGTRLIGKVTEVQAGSGEQHNGHLAFVFRQAILSDGRQVPIHAALNSIGAPGAVSARGATEYAAVAASPQGMPVSGGAPTVDSAPIRVTSASGSTVYGTTGVMAQSTFATFTAVSNVPGVTASSSAANSSILDAKGSDVELSRGTQMTFSVVTR